jgi:hypothetical protein
LATALQGARGAHAAGLDPYVTVTVHPKGYSLGQYAHDVANIYKALAGHAVHFSAVNEPDLNGFTAEDAADYWAYAYLGLRSVCGSKCFVVAGEFAQVNAGSKYVKTYQERIHKHLEYNTKWHAPRFWSMHDYADINGGNADHANAYAQLIADSEFAGAHIWITECGALLKFGGTGAGNPTPLSGNADLQEKGGRVFLKFGVDVPSVSRVLYYEVEADGSLMNTWDSALIDYNGVPRPVYCVITGSPIATCAGSELTGAGIDPAVVLP